VKHYEINMNISITEKKDYSYDMTPVIKFSITEKLPVNSDPEKYLRQRLGEEVKRQFGQLVEVIDNKTEEAVADADPLVE
jgi:hypothetical protein